MSKIGIIGCVFFLVGLFNGCVSTDEGTRSDERLITPALPTQFTIIALAGAHGSIDPAGALIVNLGDDVTFNIIPERTCRVDSVIIDGFFNVGSLDHYTFANVIVNHSIEVYFKCIPSWGVWK